MGSAGQMQKFINWISAKDIEEDEEIIDERPVTTNTQQPTSYTRRETSGGAVSNFRAVRSDQLMQIYHPRSLDEREKIADSLKSRTFVTLDLTRLPDVQSRKSFFDFLCGVVYGLGANIALITDGVYSIMPSGMDISNDDYSADISTESYNPLKEASIFNSDATAWMGKRQ